MDGTQKSWWIESAKGSSYGRLDGDARTSVAVLGGGIAGLTTAYLLAREGRAVTVVEADRIAAGVSGYTTAKVSVQHNLVYADLASKHGEDAARAYAHSQAAALRFLRAAIAGDRIDCDLEAADSLVYTEVDDDVDSIREEVEVAQRIGLPAELVTDSALPWKIRAGVRIANQAQFHPRRYLLAIADLIVRVGGRIVEGTRALDVSTDGDEKVVETEHGVIRCEDVVVATHYPFLDRGLLFAQLAPYRDVVVAASIPKEQDPGIVAISTGTEDGGTHSVRTASFKRGRRLLIVTGGQYKTGTESDTERNYDQLAEWTRDRFPDSRIEYRWSTQDTSSVDRLPFIGRLPNSGPHVWVATGFSAWGMTNGTLAGLLLTDLLQGRTNEYAELYDPGRLSARAKVAKFVKENVGVAKELVGGMLRPDLADPEDLEPGAAGVFWTGDGRTAAYRDDAGTLHAVSARCTHLGCTVRWNDAERSWDCPCHGSRFDISGAVLNGPAVHPLERRSS